MQIFSPYPDFGKIAQCLDAKRLNKQKVEIYQILKVLAGQSNGWKNHPAVLMAKGYEAFFIEYGLTIANQCVKNGWNDTLIPKISEFKKLFTEYKIPPYWGFDKFHSSHRQTLLFKNLNWYSQFNWSEEPKYEYWWPTKEISNL